MAETKVKSPTPASNKLISGSLISKDVIENLKDKFIGYPIDKFSGATK